MSGALPGVRVLYVDDEPSLCRAFARMFVSDAEGTVLSYPEEFKAGQTWSELGRPTTTIEEFAQRPKRGPEATGSA